MMASLPPERPIDQALSLAEAGEHDAALRHATALLEADPRSALRLWLTAWMLGILGDPGTARVALELAIQRAVDSSSLPMSVAAAHKLGELGGDRAAALAAIARVFGKGSSRLLDKRGAPPNLRAPSADFTPLPASLSHDELLKRASEAVDLGAQALALDRELGPPPQVSPQPLFSSLDEATLLAMLEIFDTRVVARGTVLVEESSVGDEAFFLARGEIDVQKVGKSGAGMIALARLGSGALFGEMALLSRSPRSASVVAAVPSVVLVANKAALDAVVTTSPSVGREFAEFCRRRMIENLVRTNFILRAASPAERPLLVERFTIRTFEAGEKVVVQGSEPEGLHLIALGEVAVVHHDQGDSTVVTRLGPGEVVGEVALILRRPAITDVVAQHPTVTLFLPRARLLELVKAHPKVFVDLYELAVKRDEETSSMAAEDALEPDEFVIV